MTHDLEVMCLNPAVYCGLYYKHIHGQFFVIFHTTILSVKNLCSL
jgi:hypothetical protein